LDFGVTAARADVFGGIALVVTVDTGKSSLSPEFPLDPIA
jgi:hypothetical protein